MSTYVMLSTLSESGRKVLRGRPGWIRKVNADVQRMGARVVAQYAVLGPYDFVTIIEAPDNATISRVSVELGARGGVAGMTMAAIPLDEFISRLERGAPPARRKEEAVSVLKIHPEKCTGCLRCELACSYMQTGEYQPAKSVIRVSPVRGTHVVCALHLYPVRGRVVHDRVSGGRDHHQRRRGQGRRSTTGASAASSARSPVPTGRCSTIRRRARPSSATSAAAPRRAPRRARRPPSPTRTSTTADWLGDFAGERTARVLAEAR